MLTVRLMKLSIHAIYTPCVDWDINNEVSVNPKGDVIGQDFFGWHVILGFVRVEGCGVPIVAGKDCIYPVAEWFRNGSPFQWAGCSLEG
jgi:hypothetical protein